MRRSWLACTLLSLCGTAAAVAETKPAEPVITWELLADCAAAYQGNWQNRQTGFNRSRDMSNMIREQSDDYKAAAIRVYQQSTKASPADAKEKIGSYVAASVERYVAMDKAEKLEAFLETCPQIDPEPAK
jgi:ribosomal protein L7/L12